jgi:hypothetical protein
MLAIQFKRRKVASKKKKKKEKKKQHLSLVSSYTAEFLNTEF